MKAYAYRFALILLISTLVAVSIALWETQQDLRHVTRERDGLQQEVAEWQSTGTEMEIAVRKATRYFQSPGIVFLFDPSVIKHSSTPASLKQAIQAMDATGHWRLQVENEKQIYLRDSFFQELIRRENDFRNHPEKFLLPEQLR